MSNKSEATWHPNSGPEVPHTDLIAWHRERATHGDESARVRSVHRKTADALAALGDTVPREHHKAVLRLADDELHTAKRERDEARAERDALAHVIEQVREWTAIAPAWNLLSREGAKAVVRIIDHAPVSLALHDAEVKAQALEQFAELARSDDWPHEHIYPDDLEARANDIRVEAK